MTDSTRLAAYRAAKAAGLDEKYLTELRAIADRPQGSRFGEYFAEQRAVSLAAAADSATARAEYREAAKAPSQPAKPASSRPTAPYVAPAPSAAELKGRAEQEAQTKAIAKAAVAKVRQEAADAAWEKAYCVNNTSTRPNQKPPASKPVYSAAQITAAGMSVERMAAADAIWDRAAKEAAKLRGHFQ